MYSNSQDIRNSILAKWHESLSKYGNLFSSDSISGTSPPSVFVGSYDYPKVLDEDSNLIINEINGPSWQRNKKIEENEIKEKNLNEKKDEGKKDDNVVDADFEEVKEDDNKEKSA